VVELPGAAGSGINRSTDRRIAFGGLVVSGAYLAVAAASLLLPASIRLGSWVPVHLVLAGAASTAIASLLPFFAAALVVARPVRPVVRVGGIAGVAIGALAAIEVYGHLAGQALPALLAGGTFLTGLGLVGIAAFVPLRNAMGPRRRLVERAYGLALANVATGVTIATLFVGGNLAVGTSWGMLKPAHAWLNLVGFATLVVVATLLHLAPTIAGARIRSRASGRLAILGIAIGAPLIAAGYASGLDPVARTGAVAAGLAAAATVWHGLTVHFDPGRGRWTTDRGWHRMTAGSLVLGQAWIGAGLAIAAGRVVVLGATPAAWSLALISGPLLIGGVVQVLLGAMTHLVSTIGPGSPQRHAIQRRLLGRAATVRLLALNAGALLVAVGSAREAAPGSAVPTGLIGVVASIGWTLGLVALAVRSGSARPVRDYVPSSAPRG
jgi:nitrite reductase (NO-forming)